MVGTELLGSVLFVHTSLGIAEMDPTYSENIEKQRRSTEFSRISVLTSRASRDDDFYNVSSRSLSIRDVADTTDPHGLLSVSAVLHYCKCKILHPYLKLLGIMGLRPIVSEPTESSYCIDFISIIYTIQVILFVIGGYILQYMACFRRDRGFCKEHEIILKTNNITDTNHEQICTSTILFSFIIPSGMHLSAYLYAIYLFRISNNENLSNLMERVFLSSSNPSDGSISHRKLVRTLWLFVGLSLIWMVLSFISVNFMIAEGDITFLWVDSSSYYAILLMKIFLIICTLWHDMIQATIIASYCLQAQLLTSYLYFLRAKLMLQPCRTIEWMKELLEFKHLLNYLNKKFAPVVCIFTIINLAWCISGVIWLLNYDYIGRDDLPIIGINILTVVLWILMALTPFIQAARLTSACHMLQEVGHEARTIPFPHQDTPVSELDSILMYTSSLRLSARLFCVPVSGKYLCLAVSAAVLIFLVLGQCHFLRDNI